MKKKIIAMLCVVAMLVNCISYMGSPMTASAEGIAEEMGYKELTFSDWGMTNGEFVDQYSYSPKDETITNLDGYALNGMIEVSSGSPNIFIGGKDDGWAGFYMCIQNGQLAFNGSGSGYSCDAGVALNTIRSKLNDDSFNLHNQEFYLRITFDIAADKSLVLGVYINGVFVQELVCANKGNGQLGAKMMVYLAGGSLDMRDVVDGKAKYTEKTLKDFGIYPGTLVSEKIGTTPDISKLDEVAVSGKVKFGTSGWLLMGHESADRGDWSGIQMYADSNNGNLNMSGTLFKEEPLKQFSVTNVDGNTCSTTEEGYVALNFDETVTSYDMNFDTATASGEIHVFMKNDSDYPRYVQMNWTAASAAWNENKDNILTIEAGATKIPAHSGWCEVVYPVTGSNQLNCWVSNSSVSTGTLLIKGYYVDTREVKQYSFTPSSTQISSEEAGVNFATDYADMRYTFDYTDQGVDMGVFVNDNFIKTISFGESTDGTCNIKELLGPCVMATGGISTQGYYEELTFEDFNIPTGTLSREVIGTKEGLECLDGVAVSGSAKFGSGWLLMGHESADRGDWSGIQMYADSNNGNLNMSGTLFKEEPLKQFSVTNVDGNTCSTTEEGYVALNFDETVTSYDMNFDTVTASGEIHVFMKNDSDYPRYVQMNWTAASAAWNENKDNILTIEAGATKIPAHSGWCEVVYPVTGSNQLNCWVSNSSVSTGTLLIKGYYVDTREVKQYSFTPSSTQISSEEAGVNFATDYVNMRYTFDYTDQGVDMGVFVNDNFIKTISFGDSTDGVYNIKELLSKYVMATGGFTHVEVFQEENAKEILEEAGYTRVTVTDFGAMGYQTYTKADGHLLGEYAWSDSLNKTYLDMNITFENITSTNDAYIRYGSSDGWHCFNISYDGTYMYVGLESLGAMIPILPQNVGLTKFDNVNVKIALDCGEFTPTTNGDATYDVADYTVSMWVNNRKVVDKQVKEGQAYAGTTLAVYMGETEGTITIDMGYSEVTRTAVSYNLADGNYLVSGNATVTRGGELVALNDYVLSAPGDYEIVTDVPENRIKYHQAVTLYKVGDVDLNGTPGEENDLVALEAIYTSTFFKANSAAEKAADLDNDGMVDAEDWQLMKQILAATDPVTELEKVTKKYHVATKSYDYLGGNEVMPIVGFYGPYNNAGYDFLSDEYFQMVTESGINLVNYSFNGAAGTSEFGSVIKTLKLAEKHKIGWFLNDSSLKANMTNKEFAQAIGRYGYYDSFFGIHIVDEPVYKTSAAASSGDEEFTSKIMDNYFDISERLNSYSNLGGFINLAPESSINNCTMKTGIESWWGNIIGASNVKDDYFDAYFDQYVDNCKPSVLSIDDYPFNDDASEGVTNAGGYFRSLSMIRGESLDNAIPFWLYVQAGGNFRDVNDSKYEYNADLVATEEETYWNVNTALAFGAKGIEWFTLLQDAKFHDENADGQGIDTNGLIDTDGDKTKFYEWARNINTHIQNVDEVLMKAESKGVITTGGYATSQVQAGYNANHDKDSTFKSPVITASDTNRLANVTSVDAATGQADEYGTIVGCFDYRDTEAYYVMNYNVTSGTSQKITLELKGDFNYRVVQQGQSEYNVIGTTCELTIPAGEAVLVVLDGVAGDANGDGMFDSRDLVRHKRVDAAEARIEFAQGYESDLTGDEIVDKLDEKRVRYYLAKGKFGVH